jgi:deoxyribonuclease-4
MKNNETPILIGAHTSAAGGVHNALLEGAKIGATTIQLFTANQKRWSSKPLSEEAISLWKSALDETGLTKVMSHDSYLINLSAPDAENLQKSRKCFREEIIRCKQLEISFLNFHPGSALADDPQRCLDRIVESLMELRPLLEHGSLRILMEATAGQGSSLGYRFEHLAYLISKMDVALPIGVCIDTCHVFAAGYDVRTNEACELMLKEFDRIVGLKHLYAFHLNDSQKPLGSRVDRHACLGERNSFFTRIIPLKQRFGEDMRTRIKQLKYAEPGKPSLIGTQATVKGWIRTVRNQKTFAFVEINDGSTLSNFQVVVNADLPGYEKILEQLSTGVAVVISGTVAESPGKNQELELHAKELQIIGACDPAVYPLQKKRHSF